MVQRRSQNLILLAKEVRHIKSNVKWNIKSTALPRALLRAGAAAVVLVVCGVVGFCFLRFAAPMAQPEPERTAVDADLQPDAGRAALAAEEPSLPEYDPACVLVDLASGVTADEAEALFAESDDLRGVTVVEQTAYYTKLALPDTLAVEDAVPSLRETGIVKSVQPDYYYYPQGTASARSASREVAESVARLGDAAASTASSLAGSPLGSALGSGEDGGLAAQQVPVPNDPQYSDQWALSSINAPQAWDAVDGKGEGSSSPVIVAVLDDMFYMDNVDLPLSCFSNPYDAVTGQPSTDLYIGGSNHGTHVSGIISAQTDNGVGVAGVTYNNCKVMPVKLFYYNNGILTSSTSMVLKGYSYLIERRAAGDDIRVANCSIALNNPSGEKDPPNDGLFYKVISDAYEAGIVTVAAACNAGNGQPATPPFYAYPSDFDRVVSVINLKSDAESSDRVSRYQSGAGASNYNTEDQKAKDIAAPGTSIISTSTGTNSFVAKTGTSMAAPVVSAVLGLIFTVDPDLTPDEATSKLFSTARDLTAGSLMGLGWDRESGYGEVDAAAAVSDRPYLHGSSVLYAPDTELYSVKVAGQAVGGFTWSSSDESVATIDSTTGELTAIRAGETIVTATNGTEKAQQTVTVYGISGSDTVPTGVDVSYEIGPLKVKDWSWSTSDPSIASVDSGTGKLTTHKAGSVEVRASSDSDRMSKTVNVAPGDLSDGDVTISFEDATYSGRPLVPVPKVSYNGIELEAGTHFSVSCSNNVNVGTASATIVGIGDFTGSRAAEFKIVKAPMSRASITLAPSSFKYDGKPHAPRVEVRDIGENSSTVLSKGADYTLKKNRVSVGSGSVSVTATSECRNFTGTVSLPFSVVSKTVKMYRLYNARTGEHFYTASASERAKLRRAGWRYEGVGWKALEKSTKPVYRLYNKFTGDHHYTRSASERFKLKKAGWKYEGIGWYSSDSSNKKPVYRLYNPSATTGAHFYTTKKKERDSLVKHGWKYEGIGWYA